MNKLSILGLALAAASCTASAQTEFGLSLGLRNHYGLGCAAGAACDRNASASGKAFLDFTVTPDFGIGVMAWRTGRAQGTFQAANGPLAGSGRSDGLAVTAYLPLTVNDFTFKGRIGLGTTRGRVDYSGGGSDSKTSFQPVIGAGVSYALDKNWSLNADWDRLPTRFSSSEKNTLNMFSLGASYKF